MFSIFISITASLNAVTVYEDGEDGGVDKWRVRRDPVTITNVYSPRKDSRVIKIQGGGSTIIGAISGENAWNNREEKTISWKMNVSNRYTIYVVVNTIHGIRFLFYNDLPQRILRHGTLGGILHGLGGYRHNEYKGVWRTYTRDLEADLKDSEPDNEIISVNGLIYNGSDVWIDDIMLYNPQEHPYGANVGDWRVSDNTPAGATIQQVDDPEVHHARGDVISLQGSGVDNAYMLGDPAGGARAWRNQENSILQWKSLYYEYYEVRVGVETTRGARTLLYVNRNTYTPSGGLMDNGMTIWHDLGGWSIIGRNGWEQRRDFGEVNHNWQTITRDLQQDLSDFERGNEIIAVNSFEVRGSGLIDDIKMLSRAEAAVAPVLGERHVYEDAEDGNIEGWHVYDNSPEGATIQNVMDQSRGGHVIELHGDGQQNGYEIGRRRGAGAWSNQEHKSISWSMNFSEAFSIYVAVQTANGPRYMLYTASDSDAGRRGNYIRLGLGANVADGTWRTFTRNLEADLHQFEPDNDLQEINAFLVRGSGRIDDITTLVSDENQNNNPVYEDAEDGDTNGWSIFAGDEGATIRNIDDATRGSRVIELSGDGRGNGYILGARQGANAWNNRRNSILSWCMNYTEPFTIYISVETTNGRRYLTYTPQDDNRGLRGQYILYGLGANVANGTWRDFSRNLADDINSVEPGNQLLSVNAFMIRGSGRLDDIRMSD